MQNEQRQSGLLSVWNGSVTPTRYPPLGEQRSFDAVVVGAGIVGLTAALRLKEAGLRVAVIEARNVGSQVTGCSTAKITSQHGLLYRTLIDKHGREKAKAYADANQHGLEAIATSVERLDIACDLERKDAYVFSRSGETAEAIRAEAEAAASLGLPSEYVSEAPIGVPVAGAMRFTRQAQFHPRKYLFALAAAVEGAGSAVFEGTRVTDVDDGGLCRVATEVGTVEARDVVIATHMPILDRGGFFARAYPRAHVALAARVADRSVADGMFICLDGEPRSARVWNDGAETYLIVLSEGFVPGEADDVRAISAELEATVRRDFPVLSVDYRWMTEDYDSMDGIPFAGKLTPLSNHIFIATGFSAWGISNGAATAEVVADAILGRPNPWAELYDSTRPGAKGTGDFLKRNLHVGAQWVKGHAQSAASRAPDNLEPGEGAVAETPGGKRAFYRDDSGVLHGFSPYCTHLKCLLSWNGFAQTWDCSCHGSRFSATGEVLHGPAVRPMQEDQPR